MNAAKSPGNGNKPAKAKKKSARKLRAQVAALPWRMTDRLEIMLVSSRETRRWIVPKGWPMAGRSPSAAAAIEAMEEAGLLGAIDETPFGHFFYEKKFSRVEAAPCRVDVFPLRVSRQRKDWPEKHERETVWFDAEIAAQSVSDHELGVLIRRFAAHLLG